MRTPTRALVALGATALVVAASACGSDHATDAHGTRTVEMTMTDNAFTPTQVPVGRGETITFVFRNEGTVRHEAVLGDDAAQQRHHDEMNPTGTMGTTMPTADHGSMGTMMPTTMDPGSMGHGMTDVGAMDTGTMGPDGTGMGHDDGHGGAGADSVTVDPGSTGQLTRTFDQAGTLVIGCHEPGHWEAGMQATVIVT